MVWWSLVCREYVNYSQCTQADLFKHYFMVGCVSGDGLQRLDTETQIEDWPPFSYGVWPPTSQNF